MKTLPQHLVKETKSVSKKIIEGSKESAEIFYLDDPVHVLTRNCVEWHPEKDLEILSIYNTVCPLHDNTLVILDG